MRAQFMFVAPILRALGLPAFMSPDVADVTRVDLNYSSAKARRDLGWRHPDAATMWGRILAEERALVEQRHGLRARRRHLAVLP